jgi:hypothetical protein
VPSQPSQRNSSQHASVLTLRGVGEARKDAATLYITRCAGKHWCQQCLQTRSTQLKARIRTSQHSIARQDGSVKATNNAQGERVRRLQLCIRYAAPSDAQCSSRKRSDSSQRASVMCVHRLSRRPYDAAHAAQLMLRQQASGVCRSFDGAARCTMQQLQTQGQCKTRQPRLSVSSEFAFEHHILNPSPIGKPQHPNSLKPESLTAAWSRTA